MGRVRGEFKWSNHAYIWFTERLLKLHLSTHVSKVQRGPGVPPRVDIDGAQRPITRVSVGRAGAPSFNIGCIGCGEGVV